MSAGRALEALVAQHDVRLTKLETTFENGIAIFKWGTGALTVIATAILLSTWGIHP